MQTIANTIASITALLRITVDTDEIRGYKAGLLECALTSLTIEEQITAVWKSLGLKDIATTETPPTSEQPLQMALFQLKLVQNLSFMDRKCDC